MNAEKYRQVLINYAITSGKGLLVLVSVKSYLERKTADKTLTVMDWPPQSPDLNIIEAVWDHLDRVRNKGQPKSKEELWEVLKEA